MLIYNKRVFTFAFIYKSEKYEVIYTKKYNSNSDDIVNDFKVTGNSNHLSKATEILEENKLEISEELECDLELEEINFKDLHNVLDNSYKR